MDVLITLLGFYTVYDQNFPARFKDFFLGMEKLGLGHKLNIGCQGYKDFKLKFQTWKEKKHSTWKLSAVFL